jgi:hypothetical protein
MHAKEICDTSAAESIKFNVLLAPAPASPLLTQTTRTDEVGF